MRKIIAALPVLVSIILFSCQKEVSFGNGNGSGGGTGGGGTSGNTLVKTVAKTGTDSVVTIYTYNASKRLVNHKITGIQQGFDAGNEYRYYRNASGIITHYVQINPNLVVVGIDSVTTFVHYDATTSRYTSTVAELSLFGFSVTDSTVLVYDAAGKVIRTDVYQSIPLIGGYDLSIRVKYTYAANGNVMQLDTYDATSGTDDLVSTIKYTYDAKTSALNVSATFTKLSEAFAIGHGDWVSVNNATKVEIIDVNTPANNQTSTVTYTYNSGGRPATGINTRGTVVDNLTFFYQ